MCVSIEDTTTQRAKSWIYKKEFNTPDLGIPCTFVDRSSLIDSFIVLFDCVLLLIDNRSSFFTSIVCTRVGSQKNYGLSFYSLTFFFFPKVVFLFMLFLDLIID